MFPPKLLAFDLDGTLAESKQPLSPNMGALLKRLLQRMPVAVMSGAGFPQFEKQFLSHVPADANLKNLYLFPINAAQCYLFANGAWRARYDQQFSPEERRKIQAALTEAMKKTGFDTPPEQVWGDRIEDRGGEISFSYFGQLAPIETKKTWDPDEKKRIAMRDILVPLLPECSIGIGGMTTIDITRRGITKAYGVERLVGITGIPVSDMLYAGDALFPGGNDAIVKESGIATKEVRNVGETAAFIESVLSTGPNVAPGSSIRHLLGMKILDIVLNAILAAFLIGGVVFLALSMWHTSPQTAPPARSY